MNHLLVARHDGVDRRILPRPQTFETKLACVIGERCGNVHGEEHRRNLTDHGPSLPQMAWGAPLAGIARASFRAAGGPRQATSFDVISVIVRREILYQGVAFFRV